MVRFSTVIGPFFVLRSLYCDQSGGQLTRLGRPLGYWGTVWCMSGSEHVQGYVFNSPLSNLVLGMGPEFSSEAALHVDFALNIRNRLVYLNIWVATAPRFTI